MISFLKVEVLVFEEQLLFRLREERLGDTLVHLFNSLKYSLDERSNGVTVSRELEIKAVDVLIQIKVKRSDFSHLNEFSKLVGQ
jgi:hypothetical protein